MKALGSHLKTGAYCGLTAGIVFVFLEAVYLLFSLGNFLLEMPYFIRFVFWYGLAGSAAGLLGAAFCYAVLLRKRRRTGRELAAFYGSMFLGAGFFLELFFYLMDIFPFGGPNKWSPRTLSLAVAGALLAAILALAVYRGLKKILGRFGSRIFPGRPRLREATVPAGVLFLSILIFGGWRIIDEWGERNALAGRKNLSARSSPNVMIILVDALRPDHLSGYGYFLPTSPRIDALASEGVLFHSVLAASTWSIPAHASLFTGLYPSSHGACSLFSVLGEEVPTLAGILSQNGYCTLGLYDNPLLTISGLNRGFDLAIGIENDRRVSFTLRRLYHKFVARDPLSDSMMEIARRWVEHCDHLDRPFFIFLNLFDVHSPYVPREPYFSEFIRRSAAGRANLPLIRKLNSVSGTIQDKLDLLPLLTAADWSYLLRLYDSNIAYEDSLIGDFLGWLRLRDRYDDTLVVVTADHGEFLGERHYLGHFAKKMYNPVLKIPLIIRLPGEITPGIRDDFVSQVDIFPTILSLIGLRHRIPAGTQGSDLFSSRGAEGIIAEFWDDQSRGFTRAFVAGKMKLILGEQGDCQLYDLEQDPDEENDLAPARPREAEGLREKLTTRLGSFKRYEGRVGERNRKELRRILESLSYTN